MVEVLRRVNGAPDRNRTVTLPLGGDALSPDNYPNLLF